jgi:hypothetical protein
MDPRKRLYGVELMSEREEVLFSNGREVSGVSSMIEI